MSVASLVLDEQIASQLAAAAREPLETAGVLIVGVAKGGRGTRLIGRKYIAAPSDGYDQREDDGLVLNPRAWAPALAQAETLGGSALFVHTHPGGIPEPSRRDEGVDRDLAEPFRIRTGSPVYGSMVMSLTGDAPGFAFTCALETAPGSRVDVSELLVVGRRLRAVSAWGADRPHTAPALFDRQVKAFGGDVQAVLGRLRVGVAGAGGTGSAVLEQLVRLGVRDIVLADPDDLTDSNVTRVYGSRAADVGKAKVDVQRRHLTAIAPDLSLRTLRPGSTYLSTARALAGCDVVFGCTDDEAGRIVLSRLAYYYLIPVIDCGVLLSSDGGRLLGIDGRVTTMVLGQACLVCRNRVDLARAAAETLDPEQLRARQHEGYAPELAGQEPAVVTYTTSVAALAVGELVERLTGHGPDPAPSELILRLHEREISTNSHAPGAGHFCDPATGRQGAGDVEPFLHWTWPDEATAP